MLKHMWHFVTGSVDRWVENPYWQKCGEVHFQHKLPPEQYDPISRIGESGCELILQTVTVGVTVKW